MKKLISCLLITVMLVTLLVGCNKDKEAPDGMFSATISGEPFKLYVPDGWVDNRDSGISSAYYSLENAVTASAGYYPAITSDGSVFSLDGYIDACLAQCEETYKSFNLDERKTSALGDTAATYVRYSFVRSVTSNGANVDAGMTVVQYYTLHGDDVVVLSIYCKTEAYLSNEDYLTMFEQIRSEFVLCEKQAGSEAVTDKNTPEGMKLASADNAQYRFYVPVSWEANMSDRMSDAYYPESGKPNVSVSAYSPDAYMTPEAYFEQCQDIYKKEIPGYTYDAATGAEPRQVAERAAVSYTYTATYGGTEYKIMQTVLEYNDLIYSITYTSPADRFDAHIEDVELMLTSFKFR